MFLVINLIFQIAFAALPSPTGAPMKRPMGYILNSVINADLKQAKLESDPLIMKNYQLFIYVGQRCKVCSPYLAKLNNFALTEKKSINVVVVYDHSSKIEDSLIQLAASSPVHEFFDGQGHMYHNLFDSPQYLNYILTGPQHSVIKSGVFSSVDEIDQLYSLIKK